MDAGSPGEHGAFQGPRGHGRGHGPGAHGQRVRRGTPALDPGQGPVPGSGSRRDPGHAGPGPGGPGGPLSARGARQDAGAGPEARFGGRAHPRRSPKRGPRGAEGAKGSLRLRSSSSSCTACSCIFWCACKSPHFR